jgi:hypothetical protein
VDRAPIITQDVGVQPEILHATSVEEQPVRDDSRKKEVCINSSSIYSCFSSVDVILG